MKEIEFNVLTNIYKNKEINTEKILSENKGLNNDELKSIILDLKNRDFITEAGLSKEANAALEPYKVDCAIIMAAGICRRCRPLSNIIPKGLFRIKGEILLERQIMQLKSAGVNQIVLVVGYMKEQFNYLVDKFGVTLVVNDDYIERNNLYSLYVAQKYLKNTYICCSDLYYPRNFFSQYEYDSYFACKFSDGFADEYCITETKDGYITKIENGGVGCWYDNGHVYFNKTFNQKYIEFLNNEWDLPEAQKMYFNTLYIKHIDKLPARIKEFKDDDIFEFDTMREAINFDGDFRQFIVDKLGKDWVEE